MNKKIKLPTENFNFKIFNQPIMFNDLLRYIKTLETTLRKEELKVKFGNKLYDRLNSKLINDTNGDSVKLTDRIISYKNNANSVVRVCDVGSGAGFPGLACFLMLSSQKHQIKMTLIESNRKKCEFLTLVKDKLMLPVSIINERVERIKKKYDILLSRAVAPLHILLGLLAPLSKKDTILLLPKGKSYSKEIKKAKKLWNFSYKVVNNNHLLDKSGGVTLEIINLKKIN